MRDGKIVFTFNSVKFELSGLIRVASLFLFEFALCCSGDMNLIYFRVTTTQPVSTGIAARIAMSSPLIIGPATRVRKMTRILSPSTQF